MKVLLQKDVKNLGQAGDIVSVKNGYARHCLFPKKWALFLTEGRKKEQIHRQHLIQVKRKKATRDRKTLADQLKEEELSFTKQVDDKGRLFGSVSAFDISKKLEEKGFLVDKRHIQLKYPLKQSGTHEVSLKWSQDLESKIKVHITSRPEDSSSSPAPS